MPRWISAMVVPSLGAPLNMKLVAAMLPAAGMFWTTMVGLPGMCLPRCRAAVRACRSYPPPTPAPTMKVICLPA